MNKKILEKAQKVIDLRRFDAENKAVNNKIEALKNSEFKTLYESYVTSMIDDAKQGIESKKTEGLKLLVDEKAKSMNLYCSPSYVCPLCNDTGRINGSYCDCLKREINKILVEQSGFNHLQSFEEAKFDIFEGQNREYMQKLYQKMKAWCHSNFDKNLIFLAGETGVGKTHLMQCIAKELIDRNILVTLTTSFAMNQDFLKSYACKDLEEKNDILDKYLNTQVLFIDDLGTELRRPDVTVNYLYLILNERKVKKLPTIITSNLTLEEIADYYDERISSRIADKSTSICVYIKGKDLRLQN